MQCSYFFAQTEDCQQNVAIDPPDTAGSLNFTTEVDFGKYLSSLAICLLQLSIMHAPIVKPHPVWDG